MTVVSLVGPRASGSKSLNKEEEEKITMQVEGVQKEPGASGISSFHKRQKEKKKSKLVGWSTENMEEKQRNQEFKHSEEMVPWRSVDQEGMNQMWKTLSKIEGRSAGQVPSGGQQQRSIQRKR